MRSPDERPSTPPNSLPGALSQAARAVGDTLAGWRTRIAETQTLVRLTLSLLKGDRSVSDFRRGHLGRLTAIEARAVAQLPEPDFASLRTTTTARASGIDLRGPDTIAAERYVVALRDEVANELRNCTADDVSASVASLERIHAKLDELSRSVDLVETMLFPRVNDPTVEIGVAVERAAAARSQSVVVEGAVRTPVRQVRGLLRLIAEVIAAVGDSAYVHVSRAGGWVELSVAPNATGAVEPSLAPGRIEFLRFAGYLIRAQAELREGAWRMAFVAAEA
jgi:hypothetical protein